MLQGASIVIVGGGPVGTRIVRDILSMKPDAELIVYSDEPWEPYDRVKLVSLLSGDLAWADLQNLPSLPENHKVIFQHNNRITAIDREKCEVIDSYGKRQPYSKLILAIGSQPWIPDIPGADLPGIHVFRNISDVQGLLDKGYAGRKVVVLGGGLLGVELSCGLRKKGEQVTIVVSGRLLGRQLDERAGQLLHRHLDSLGIKVIFGRAAEIVAGADEYGELTAKVVHTFCGQKIECDCVVLATGIVPMTDLALDSEISTGRGIKVNDYLQTSDPLIYAAGECAEHRGRVYGLIGPGFEQADIVAKNVLGERVKYHGSNRVTMLKGTDFAAFSCFNEEPETDSEIRSIQYESSDHSKYRALHLNKGRLIGVICIGDWPEAWQVRDAVLEKRLIMPWQSKSFLATGNLWAEGRTGLINQWPKHATVCNCTGVTRGLLDVALEQGHCDVEALKSHTKAGTGCGSCVPLLAEFVGRPEELPCVEGASKLAKASILALLSILVVYFMPELPVSDTTLEGWRFDELWLNNGWKQLTGFGLLLISCIVSAQRSHLACDFKIRQSHYFLMRMLDERSMAAACKNLAGKWPEPSGVLSSVWRQSKYIVRMD